MNCPKCVGKLNKKNIEGTEVDVCFVCEGIWFDAEELERVIKSDAKDFRFKDVDREEFDGVELAEFARDFDVKPAYCPRCEDKVLLLRREYKGKHNINVDICPKCHGIWLDGGEIQELRKRGLVNLRDKIDFHLVFLRYIFSMRGFRDFMQAIFKEEIKDK